MQISHEMIKGTVVPIVLRLLSERSMYGYEIIKEVMARTDNVLEYKEGTLYPWLHRLEGDGVISSEWGVSNNGRKRKYYALTRKGVAMLAQGTEEWATFSKAVNILLLSPA